MISADIKSQKPLSLLISPKTLIVFFFLLLLTIPKAGFCAGETASHLDDVEQSARKVMDLIFSKQLRFTFLVFACGFGVIKATLSQSLQPALISIGIGSLFFFMPKIIEAFNALFP